MWELDHKEGWRIDAFKLCCGRRLLRVPWIARISNQSILKEINSEYSLEGLILKPQYFGHLMRIADSLKKTLICWERLRAGGEGKLESYITKKFKGRSSFRHSLTRVLAQLLYSFSFLLSFSSGQFSFGCLLCPHNVSWIRAMSLCIHIPCKERITYLNNQSPKLLYYTRLK